MSDILTGSIVMAAIVLLLLVTLQRNKYPLMLTILFRIAHFWLAAARGYQYGVESYRFGLLEAEMEMMATTPDHGSEGDDERSIEKLVRSAQHIKKREI